MNNHYETASKAAQDFTDNFLAELGSSDPRDICLAAFNKGRDNAIARYEKYNLPSAHQAGAAKAWNALLIRFSPKIRGHLANLLAHNWSICEIAIDSKHGDGSNPNRHKGNEMTAMQASDKIDEIRRAEKAQPTSPSAP